VALRLVLAAVALAMLGKQWPVRTLLAELAGASAELHCWQVGAALGWQVLARE